MACAGPTLRVDAIAADPQPRDLATSRARSLDAARLANQRRLGRAERA